MKPDNTTAGPQDGLVQPIRQPKVTGSVSVTPSAPQSTNGGAMPAENQDVLLLVAVKTDQANIQRRLSTILAAAEPTQDPPDTVAQVDVTPVEKLSANDLSHLGHFFGWNGVHALNVGALASEGESR